MASLVQVLAQAGVYNSYKSPSYNKKTVCAWESGDGVRKDQRRKRKIKTVPSTPWYMVLHNT